MKVWNEYKIFAINYGLIVFLSICGISASIFIIFVFIYRYLQRKRDENETEVKSFIDNDRVSKFCTFDRDNTMKNLAINAPSMTKIKIADYKRFSSSSSSDEEGASPKENYVPGFMSDKSNFVVTPVQPPKEKEVRNKSSSSSQDEAKASNDAAGRVEKEATITFSIWMSPEGQDWVEKEKEMHLILSLMRANHLKRASSRNPSGLTATFRSGGPGLSFRPEGVFTRIYYQGYSSKIDTGRRRSSSVELECGAIKRERSSQQSSLEYKQTSTIMNKKSKVIKFNDGDKVTLKRRDFPIRITVYDVDKHGVRSSIGHSVIDWSDDMLFSNQILTRRLYRTVFQATNSSGQ